MQPVACLFIVLHPLPRDRTHLGRQAVHGCVYLVAFEAPLCSDEGIHHQWILSLLILRQWNQLEVVFSCGGVGVVWCGGSVVVWLSIT